MDTIVATPATVDVGRPWLCGFASLGAAFYTELASTPLASPYPISFNASLACDLGLDVEHLGSPAVLGTLAGNLPFAGSQPLATVYSGHQFGAWAGQLGDGRAILLGEIDAPLGAQDLQLKGSGRTPYSRMGRRPCGPAFEHP